MSTKNKSVATQALLEMDSITSAIKEESKKSIKNLLKESVAQALRESCENEEDEDKPEIYNENDADDKKENDSADDAKSDVDENGNEDVNGNEPQEPTDIPQDGQEGMEPQEAPMDGENGAIDDTASVEPTDNGEGNDGADDFSQYQVGDNTYDLTGENDLDKIVKVYKLLSDDDNVVVTKDGDTINLKDNQAGTEYVIDFGEKGEDAPEAQSINGEDNTDPTLNESQIAGFDDDDDDYNIDYDDENMDDMNVPSNNSDINDKIAQLQAQLDALKDSQNNNNNVFENKRPMKGNKETVVEVDLGYTDNYQDKDPIAGLSNNEPSKSGKSWHKGVPTGTSKPWAGETKTKGDPFKKTEKVEGSVNEEESPIVDGTEEPVEEATNVGGAVQQRTSSKSHIPTGRKEHGPNVKRHVSAGANYDEVVAENKNLKEQVKKLSEAIVAIKNNLNEAYLTNKNISNITKLFLENSTSQSEKHEIVNRFSKVKSVKESQALFESINSVLKKNNKTININENSMTTVNDSKAINENKSYKSDDLIKTIDLINRVMKY